MDLASRNWMMLWTIMGRPAQLPPTRMRAMCMEAFLHVKRLECVVDDNTTLSVLKLFNANGVDAHNFPVTLRIHHPERRRYKNEEHQHQYPEMRVQEAVVEALDCRMVSPP